MSDNLKKRTNRFSQRVDIERQVISMINRSYGEITPLTGLTKKSYDSWAYKICGHVSEIKIQKINKVVSEIIYRVQLNCDASKDVFSEYPISNVDKPVDELIHQLANVIST